MIKHIFDSEERWKELLKYIEDQSSQEPDFLFLDFSLGMSEFHVVKKDVNILVLYIRYPLAMFSNISLYRFVFELDNDLKQIRGKIRLKVFSIVFLVFLIACCATIVIFGVLDNEPQLFSKFTYLVVYILIWLIADFILFKKKVRRFFELFNQ